MDECGRKDGWMNGRCESEGGGIVGVGGCEIKHIQLLAHTNANKKRRTNRQTHIPKS